MFNPPNPIDVASAEDVERVTAEVAGLRAQLAGFAGLQQAIAFILDAKVCAKRVEELIGLTTAAIEAKAALEATQADFDNRSAALDRYQARVDEKAVEIYARKCEVENKQQQLLEIQNDITAAGARFRREILRYAGVAQHHNEQFASLPDWDGLAATVLGPRDDAHHAEVPEGTFAVEAEPAPDRPAGSNLTRTPGRNGRKG
jgi:hypothetical protein